MGTQRRGPCAASFCAPPRDPMVPAKTDVHPDTDPALFVCQNPETVLQTDRSAPKGLKSHRNHRAGPGSSGRLAYLSSLRGGRFWFDIEPESHFLGNPPSELWSGRKGTNRAVAAKPRPIPRANEPKQGNNGPTRRQPRCSR